ncbi:hypothetical protein AGMMS49574_11170 [Bacteroidia bacterium]|nr:hypothetical protein AGMMS49574_11170 [Bacteroidia bacterium]
MESEEGAGFGGGRDSDIAAMAGHDLSADTETDAGAAGLGSEERNEYFPVRYEDDIKQLTSKDEWEIEVNECLDN